MWTTELLKMIFSKLKYDINYTIDCVESEYEILDDNGKTSL